MKNMKHKYLNEITKTFQDTKVEIETLKMTQNDIKLGREPQEVK